MVRPFLKWPGGKYRITNCIKALLPAGERLVEPFAGSGAVFLNTDYSSYWLNDANSDLINLYCVLQKEGKSFIKYCRSFFTPENNTPERYYELRTVFNTTPDTVLKSALLVYLNRHGYNGLVRYNSQGEYNVPFGQHKKPYFPETEMEYFFHKSQKAKFTIGDFSEVMAAAQPGDVFYCDPPYVPLSSTANFVTYSTGGFSLEQQERLAILAVELSQKGIPVLISNHDTVFTETAYREAKVTKLQVRRSISCNGSNRSKVGEVLALFEGRLGYEQPRRACK
ncbi:Dam family site-specific DNA-(adenine-N6)-methyltransferase [Thermanaerosceptrum fracticalcis]|jgi:DNA adenine methylase|uniref:site-specific DNA-methyltransferase (adenine-specific) n=1 Tax=Thermanaerosceptrum fracticalcis TaxID=1712410 RepID=A0A7G6DZX7_THEFR|nr:Dam family site-specific DNA-(adenine-N6)-methyltransferase [Thermanaerosceptrum fracticalcis]QNB45381.1 Dam family site-specific DNA-(adenine-N6)-methyltransferase [Thermanaerosceptrum fracticalcis]